MIIDSANETQANIFINRAFYQAMSTIMQKLEKKGYANSADETMKVISAYTSIISKKAKLSNFNEDYNLAFKKIDEAIESVACTVFYQQYDKKFDFAYTCFENFDHISTILSRQRTHKV